MKKFMALTLALIMSLTCFSLVSFATETDGVEHLTEVPDGYVGIYNKDDLDNIKLDVTGKYILMNDIVFEDSDYVKGGSFYNSGKGWEPIGTSSTNFTGTFDGNNYRIKNLYINNPTQNYIGLFGCINGATITRVSLENANITGKNYVGGIVGYSYGEATVSYCNVQGSISGMISIGGIVGYQYSCNNSNNYKNITYNYVEYCSNTANVIGETEVGGIVGYSDSYQYNRDYYSYIKNCYNTGNVSGSKYVGGLVGGSETSELSYVQHCYSLGSITATSDFGGCFGNNPTGYLFCYYLDEAVVNPTCTAGTPKSEDQLKKATTFEQWDFKTIWTTKGREDYPYPEIIGSHPVLPEDGMHKHEYTSEITIPATHLAEGVMTFTCECGDTYTEAIAKTTEHSYTSEVTTQPTHLAEGVETYTCECGDTYTEVIAKTTEHSYTSEVTTQSTHLAEGVETFTCECGDTYTEAIAKTTDHSYDAVVTAPTCIAQGYTTYTCECGYSYNDDFVNALGHNFEPTVTAPTCTTKGYTTYTCACGETYVADTVDATGHNFVAIVTAPTCVKYGYTTFVCICGENYVGDYVSVKGHIDNNNDYKCDYNCGFEFEKIDTPTPSDPTKDCSCDCHNSGLAGLLFKLINFFQKLFGMNKVCACGMKH